MVGFLARRMLRRTPARTGLLVIGVAVAGALVFDMAMLGRGLERSFGEILATLGYEIRVVLRGTLPLTTEALLPRADAVARDLGRHPEVAAASPVLVHQVYAETPTGALPVVVVGLRAEVTGIVRPLAGAPAGGVLMNGHLAARLGVRPGEHIRLAARLDPQTGALLRARAVRVDGLGEFVFDLQGQRSLAMPVETLRDLLGVAPEAASFLVVRLRPGADPEAVTRWIDTAFPALEALSIERLLAQVRRQLVYFRHFAAILSGVGLLLAALLIGAVLTVAVGERLGELAVLRAMGLTRWRIVQLVLVEGLFLAAASMPLALVLGVLVGRPLDAILRATPGIPQDLHFFVVTPGAAARAVGTVLVTAVLGAVYPAWIAGRLNVSAMLHQEVQ
ncbi:MAG: FtsX-like permease family protein [Armatimonadota bacterium]|nr:FtsX-like permease family protein [Armatimonadota bacterium]MDR7484795.1 FtsX-like permease family protein [Armatimonadota bacterium]MDR7531910.1 FtsX-like permease family protein [Armatimonadota bacterium]MDR7534745.1 FtsX-like permease family protein [Armatimonadota bacterium]